MITKNFLIAVTLYVLWLSSLARALTIDWSTPISVLGMMFWLTFLYTGLFIEAHDGMHGSLAPESRLNHLVAMLFVWSYGSLSYRRLREEHLRHHRHPGIVHDDPDFHRGQSSFWRWYMSFMVHYSTRTQYLFQTLVFLFLHLILGVPWERLILFWAIPSLLSTLQFFTFGTYLPHRPGTDLDENKSRSSGLPWVLSLLTCYHFGLHREHHRQPTTPWWELPRLRCRE